MHCKLRRNTEGKQTMQPTMLAAVPFAPAPSDSEATPLELALERELGALTTAMLVAVSVAVVVYQDQCCRGQATGSVRNAALVISPVGMSAINAKQHDQQTVGTMARVIQMLATAAVWLNAHGTDGVLVMEAAVVALVVAVDGTDTIMGVALTMKFAAILNGDLAREANHAALFTVQMVMRQRTVVEVVVVVVVVVVE
jgi:hypothetical protein